MHFKTVVRGMKITGFLLLIAFLHTSATGLSQNVSLHVKDAPLEQVFNQIKQQIGLSFLLGEQILQSSKPVTVDLNDKPVSEALDAILKNQNLTYSILQNMIVIKKSEPTQHAIINSPPAYIHGRITDSLDNPIAGATISVKNSKVFTVTNTNGEFSLNNIDPNAILTITSIGYEPQTISLNGRQNINISLQVQINKLKDVEVTYSNGYQNIPKERVTGSLVQIDKELLNRTVSPNVLDHILYVTSGLNYVPGSVGNTTRSSIVIRGVSTIYANKNPLIVVDNFPYDGDISDINPNDIESVTVLRDAAAASIWGVRAGNGVIVIKSKTGSYNKKATLQFNSSVMFSKKPDIYKPKIISSTEEIGFEKQLFATGYYDYYDDLYPSFNYFPVISPLVETLLALRRGAITQTEADAQIEAYQQHDIRSDISKDLLQTGVNQQYSVNFSGGSNNYNYYGSVGYDHNRTTTVGNSNHRFTARFDNSYKILPSLEANAYIVYTQADFATNGLDYMTFMPTGNSQVAPYTMLSAPDGTHLATPKDYRGSYIDTAKSPGLVDWHYRPLDELQNSDNQSQQMDARMGAGLRYIIIPGLTAEVKYQYEKGVTDVNNNFNQATYYTRNLINKYAYSDPVTGNTMYPVPLGGIQEANHSQLTQWNLRGQLNYNHTRNRSQINAIGGSEVRELIVKGDNSRVYGFNDENLQSLPVDYTTAFNLRPFGANTVPYRNFNSGTTSRYISYFANAAYTYEGKYILTASGRIDQSNFFGVNANMRQVPLWSTGLGWNISKENFFHVDWLSFLKLRATYGYNGNTNNSASAYSTIQAAYNADINRPSATLLNPPNPYLRWEKVMMTNLGVDFQMFENRLGGSIEYYYKKGIDLISPIQVDPTTGITQYTGNNASIKGHGMDIILNSVNIQSKKFSWLSTLNVSYTTDEVTSYDIKPTYAGTLLIEGTPVIGKPLYKLYNYQFAGLDPTNGNPQGMMNKSVTDFETVLYNGTPEDMVYGGSTMPDWFGSFRNTVNYKGFGLSFNIIFKFGYYFRRPTIDYLELYTNWSGNADYAKRWQKPGDEKFTTVPSLPSPVDDRSSFYEYSTAVVEKADNIRLQDIRLSYDFNPGMFHQLPFRKMQVYLYAANLGIIWQASKSGVDPDYYSTGIPPSKSVAIGLNFNF
jgi:TonB-linked SusC/RagA family outer membrane protein